MIVKPVSCPRTQQHVSFVKKRVLNLNVMLDLVPLVTASILVYVSMNISLILALYYVIEVVNGIINNNSMSIQDNFHQFDLIRICTFLGCLVS